jgi:hypothetical protein
MGINAKRLALVGLYFGLFAVWRLKRDEWLFPFDTYSMAVLGLSIVAGLLVYVKLFGRIRAREKSAFAKWITLVFGPVFFPAMIWFPIHKPIPFLLGSFATEEYTQHVTISAKEKALRRNGTCVYKFWIREFNSIFQGTLCIDEGTWNSGKAGDKLRLFGRKNLLAFYVDGVNFE